MEYDRKSVLYTIPFKTYESVNTPKFEDEWDESDKRKYAFNARAKDTLYYALDKNKLNRIYIP